ncbi:hypothetical protein N0O92_12405 [Alkalihalobacillus sp. MEB130]|nr:hypothetical protein [Alkalihalobacillus sp. MEB130]MDT8861036.1 hypothetical protein [Alkalihalobacillus sp. MEB130]
MAQEKRSNNHELREPIIGLGVGMLMMIIAFLIAHFVFDLQVFS